VKSVVFYQRCRIIRTLSKETELQAWTVMCNKQEPPKLDRRRHLRTTTRIVSRKIFTRQNRYPKAPLPLSRHTSGSSCLNIVPISLPFNIDIDLVTHCLGGVLRYSKHLYEGNSARERDSVAMTYVEYIYTLPISLLFNPHIQVMQLVEKAVYNY